MRVAQRSLVALAAFMLMSPGAAGSAHAFNLLLEQWDRDGDINVPFKMNTSSFQSGRLPGLTLTADQVRFWAGFALGQWRVRTNAAILFSFQGETTTNNDQDCKDTNGESTVAAVAGCANGTDCFRLGGETPYYIVEDGLTACGESGVSPNSVFT